MFGSSRFLSFSLSGHDRVGREFQGICSMHEADNFLTIATHQVLTIIFDLNMWKILGEINACVHLNCIEIEHKRI